MNSRVILASLILFHATNQGMDANSDLTLADFKPLFSREEIQNAISQTANELSRDYKGKTIAMVMVMKGAIHVVSDLMRSLKVPVTLDYVQASSYGQNGTQPGKLTLTGIEQLNLTGKDVLLVDDIVDTGETLSHIKREFFKQNPASLKTLVLLKKSQYDPSKEYNLFDMQKFVDYPIFTIGNAFVIGYGLDYKEKYRELPGIWVKKEKE